MSIEVLAEQLARWYPLEQVGCEPIACLVNDVFAVNSSQGAFVVEPYHQARTMSDVECPIPPAAPDLLALMSA